MCGTNSGYRVLYCISPILSIPILGAFAAISSPIAVICEAHNLISGKSESQKIAFFNPHFPINVHRLNDSTKPCYLSIEAHRKSDVAPQDVTFLDIG
jgi:hypothetical protein